MEKKKKQSVNNNVDEDLTRKEKIEVLLAEYSSRQDEKNAAATGITNIVNIAIIVIIGIMGFIFQGGAVYLWVVVPSTILVFLNMESDREFSTLYQAMYLRLLEERINELANDQLLAWESLGSSYKTIIGRFVVKPYSQKRKGVVNLNNIMMIVYVIVVILLFALGLVEGSKWLIANLSLSLENRIIMASLYVAGHILLLIFLLFNRFVQHRKLLALVEENLRSVLLR